MKNCIHSIIISLMLYSCNSQHDKICSLSSEGLRDSVKYIWETTYDVIDEFDEGKLRKTQEIHKCMQYNLNGYLTTCLHFDKNKTEKYLTDSYQYSNGNIVYTVTYNSGIVTNECHTDYDAKNLITRQRINDGKHYADYIYDTSNRLSRILYNFGTTHYETTFSYNNNGLLVEEYHTTNGKHSSTKKYEYTNNNPTTITTEIFANNRLFHKSLRENKYDNTNMLIETKYYDGNTLSSKKVYSYGSNHECLTEVEYEEGGKKTGSFRYVYTINSSNDTVNIVRIDNNTNILRSKSTITYDSLHHKKYKHDYSYDKLEPWISHNYIYNSNNDLVEHIRDGSEFYIHNKYELKYSGDNLFQAFYKSGEQTVEYLYDNNRLVSHKLREKNGEVEQYTNYKYNELGYKTEESYSAIDNDKHEYKTIYEYDNKNRVVQEISVGKKYGEIKSTTNYTYNANNDAIEIKEQYSDKKSIKTFKYKYDNRNNWIERIEYIDQVPQSITERVIEYYN